MSFITDKEIRSYLLGTLADAPREAIENTLLVSDEGLLRLEMAEEDLIEEFLDNELDQEHRSQFESQFLCTTARKEKLAYLQAIRTVAVQQQQPEPLPGNVVSFPAPNTRRGIFVDMNRSSYLKLAAAILLVSSVGFLVWRYAFRSPQSASLVALNRAYAGGRTLETRIGGFDFAPYAPTRGADDADASARILRERAGLIVFNAYAEAPTAANRHALGKYYLADKQFDKAIEQFNAALKETPTVAELHNDLGAALLEKSKYEKRNNQPGDSLQHMAASLESIEKALKLQPNYPAAVFNRALCLQEMYLPRQAIEEWKKYLQLDSKSPWADEARRRLAELEKAPSNISKSEDELYQDYLKEPENDERTFDLFCQSYSTTGNGITERLLDELLAARQSGDTAKASHRQQLLDRLGALVFQRSTDPYVSDVARYYRQLPTRLLPKLIEARHHLNQGRDLRSTKPFEALTHYRIAITLFQQGSDECEVTMTACLLARSHLRQSNYAESRKLFEKLTAIMNGYLWVRGQSLNGMAEYYQEHAQRDKSILANQSAVTLAGKTSNVNLKLTSLVNLAILSNELGNWEQVLFYQQQAFELLDSSIANLQQHWETNTRAADNLSSFGFHAAAVSYMKEALRIEQYTHKPLQLSRTYTHLGAVLGQNAQITEAIPFVQQAINIGVAMENEKMGLGIQAWSGLYLAELHRKAGNFAVALENFEHVIKLNRQLGEPSQRFELYRGKALSEIALGYTSQAKQDLAQAIAVLEINREQIFSEKDRNTFFDKEYDLYDAAIGFAYSDNPQAAFALSESARARSLLEILKGNSGKFINTASAVNRTELQASRTVQQKLSPGTSLLEFACLPDRLLIWGISSKKSTHRQNTIPLPILEQKVHAFLQVLTGKTQDDINKTKILAAELYQILIEPFETFLDGAEVVCIVPDKVLYHLPFIALYSARQQKYLIENHAIITAPSASVFILCNERARRQSSSSKRILAVGNPRFDPSVYPQLSELTAASREAEDVASNYRLHHILTVEQATEREVKEQIKHSAIIHFATHGIIDERSWPNSRLILAKSVGSTGDDDALRAYEITQMRLPITRLVVLSACESGVGHFYRGEGMIGLGRAFMAAGVPTIVASLWEIDSEATAKLMIDFHRQLKKYSVSQALRHAQLSMLYNINSMYHQPYYWAAFSDFGGDMFL